MRRYWGGKVVDLVLGQIWGRVWSRIGFMRLESKRNWGKFG